MKSNTSRRTPKEGRDIRIISVFAFFAFLFIASSIKLFALQVIEHKKYKSIAENQYWGSENIAAKRGDILTSDGYVLAGTQTYFLLFAEPKKVENKAEVAEKLAQILITEDMPLESTPSEQDRKSDLEKLENKILKTLNSDLIWATLYHNVSPEKHDQILNLKYKGIGFEEEPIRYYPEGYLASHVLGFVASDANGDKRGYYGVEGNFNEDLKGRPGRILEEVDATGVPILVGGYKKVDAIEGSTIYLTINRSLQYLVEKTLKAGVEEYEAVSGTAIVMDPYSGAILAMANYPSYIPSKFDDPEGAEKDAPYRKLIERRNLSVAQTYEPGSVMKPLTISAAIDNGLINENTTYQDDGPVVYSGKTINNWDGKHWGTMNIIQLLQKSNNIGAAWVGHMVGSKNLYKYLTNYGIGERTKVELEDEDTGILRQSKDWTDIDLANISFGQGFSTTPLQVLNAFNVMANGGFLLQPRIVSKIIDNGRIIDMPTKSIKRVISKDTSDRMVGLLEQAAAGGEAKYYVTKDYRIAGKTGTAQIFRDGKYLPDKTNATFVGFLAGDKRISILVKLEEPHSSVYASETAVPVWMNIAGEVVKLYGIPTDKMPTTNTSSTPNAPLSVSQ